MNGERGDSAEDAREPRPVPLPDRLHARLARGFDALVVELGGDPATIAGAAGLGHAPRPATYRALITLLETAAAMLDCADFGLRLARRQGGAVLGPLSLAMRHSPTLADALAYVVDHEQAHSPAARIWLQRRPAEGGVFVGHDILLAGPPGWTQAMEQIQLLGHLGAMAMTAGAARARRVHFQHQPLSPPAVYRRHFGCEVRFGQNEVGVLFHDADMACAIVDTDAGAYRAATAYIDLRFPHRARPIHADARGHVMRLMGGARCDSVAVARRLALHPRTLHRRLRAEGTSFQRVKDEVRRDVMLYYIASTKLDLGIISERLGFAEQAVMTRFCHRVFGVSPTALRVRSREGTAPLLS
jgi:AraC-like DNA-binding protein